MKAESVAAAISRCMTGKALQSFSKIFKAILLYGSIFVSEEASFKNIKTFENTLGVHCTCCVTNLQLRWNRARVHVVGRGV